MVDEMGKLCHCGEEAVWQELPRSENYPTYEACIREKLRWEYYCEKHIPPLTVGRIGGPIMARR